MIVIDAARLESRIPAHTYLQEVLDFPEYYGKNLDALYDCLTELPQTEVRFVNTENAPAYFEKIQRVFHDAARQNENLTLSEESI